MLVLKFKQFFVALITVLLLQGMFSSSVQAAPAKVLLTEWSAFDANSKVSVDHRAWQAFLSKYVKTRSGINLVKYAAVTNADKAALGKYIAYLQNIDPASLNRAEQFAYWANLYNSKTVDLVLDNYPVSSIKKIGSVISGPWNKRYLKVKGRALSLNNIEHGILRPIFNDQRIHYVLNCASIGCPNLSKQALTAKNYRSVLTRSARDFINHQRAVNFSGDTLVLSSIYDWYARDFGTNQTQLLKSIAKYAQPTLKKKLLAHKGKITFQYDWALNKG